MSDLSKFEGTGSCHCGAVRIDVKADLSSELTTCNCSICGRTGAIMAFLPEAQVTVTGADKLTDYQFGKKHIHHQFCSVCGGRPFSHGKGPDGSEMYAVNARCLEGLDLKSLKTNEYNGRDA